MDKSHVCLLLISLMLVQSLPLENVGPLEDLEIQRIAGLQQNEIAPSFEGLVGGSNTFDSEEQQSCMIADDYSLYCWGYRNLYANGFGNSTSPSIPMKVNLLNSTTFNSVVAMNLNTCVHFTNGTIGCFGVDDYYLGADSLSLDKNTSIVYPFGSTYMTTMSGSDSLVCGLDNYSTIYCSGKNDYYNNPTPGSYVRAWRVAGSQTYANNVTIQIPQAGELRQLIIGDPISEVESKDKRNLYWDYMVEGQKWIVEFQGFGEISSNSYTVDTTFKEKSPEELQKEHERFMKRIKKEMLDEGNETSDEDGEMLDEGNETSDAPLVQKPRRPFD